MYQDPKRWAFAFQHHVQLTMLRRHNVVPHAPVRVMERSIHSAQHCFVKNFEKSGLLHPAEYACLAEWYELICAHWPSIVPVGVIYLRTSPDVAFERLLERGRSEERVVSLEYLSALHELHEQWISTLACEVLIVDANLPISAVHDQLLEAKPAFIRSCLQKRG